MLTPDRILYEDNHLLVVNKAAGWLTQGDETGDPTLADFAKQYLKEKYNKPGNVFLGVVHRLDRPVSGVILLARTSKALSRMTKAFKQRKIQKTYWALTTQQPEPESGVLIHHLRKDHSRNLVTAFSKPGKETKEAELSYRLIGAINGLNLIEIIPLTGRPHQIRVQMATIGCPILGDLKYGAKKPLEDASIALHSRELSFPHPTKNETFTLKATLPSLVCWKSFTH